MQTHDSGLLSDCHFTDHNYEINIALAGLEITKCQGTSKIRTDVVLAQYAPYLSSDARQQFYCIYFGSNH
jgi:hypothetical protein